MLSRMVYNTVFVRVYVILDQGKAWMKQQEELGERREGGRGGNYLWLGLIFSYMMLRCCSFFPFLSHSYKNGSLTRERLCKDAAEGSWDLFNQLLDSTPRGNFGNIGKC